jgi:septal ring factor EnvC (AmiA/AmiB activator)
MLRANCRDGQTRRPGSYAPSSKELVMAKYGLAHPARWLPLVGFLVMTGCTVSLDPGLRGKVNADPNKAADGSLQRAVAPNLLGQTPAAPSAVAPGPPNDQISFLMQRLASVEDDRKVQAVRLLQVENQLREKEQSVVRASYEIQETTSQMKKARDDLHRWKTELDDLRQRLRSMETDHQVTLDAILKTLEQYIDKDTPKHKP